MPKYLWMLVRCDLDAARPDLAVVEVTPHLVERVSKLAELAWKHELSEVRTKQSFAKWCGVDADLGERWRTELNTTRVHGGTPDVSFGAYPKHAGYEFETRHCSVKRLQQIAADTSGATDFVSDPTDAAGAALLNSLVIEELVRNAECHESAHSRAQLFAQARGLEEFFDEVCADIVPEDGDVTTAARPTGMRG